MMNRLINRQYSKESSSQDGGIFNAVRQSIGGIISMSGSSMSMSNPFVSKTPNFNKDSITGETHNNTQIKVNQSIVADQPLKLDDLDLTNAEHRRKYNEERSRSKSNNQLRVKWSDNLAQTIQIKEYDIRVARKQKQLIMSNEKLSPPQIKIYNESQASIEKPSLEKPPLIKKQRPPLNRRMKANAKKQNENNSDILKKYELKGTLSKMSSGDEFSDDPVFKKLSMKLVDVPKDFLAQVYRLNNKDYVATVEELKLIVSTYKSKILNNSAIAEEDESGQKTSQKTSSNKYQSEVMDSSFQSSRSIKIQQKIVNDEIEQSDSSEDEKDKYDDGEVLRSNYFLLNMSNNTSSVSNSIRIPQNNFKKQPMQNDMSYRESELIFKDSIKKEQVITPNKKGELLQLNTHTIINITPQNPKQKPLKPITDYKNQNTAMNSDDKESIKFFEQKSLQSQRPASARGKENASMKENQQIRRQGSQSARGRSGSRNRPMIHENLSWIKKYI